MNGTNMECIHRSFSTGLRSPYQYAPNHHGLWRRARNLCSREETEQNGVVERIISKLCFTAKTDVDYTLEINTIYQALNTKTGLKYSLLKDMILDHLIISISTSKEDTLVRTSLAILSTIITSNTSAVDDIKRRGLQLHNLAAALKRKMHEAAILIYLINPPPAEVRMLDLLPCLVEVVCTASTTHLAGPITPPAASLMIIETLVTSFDPETNSTHLAAITPPGVLSALVRAPRRNHLDEVASLAYILAKSMCFDGKCRRYISQISHTTPFLSLLWSNQERAASAALEFFNELLKTPRYISQ